MPVEKELTKLIPRIYKWNTESMALFFFVQAQKQLFPTIKLTLAINNFRRFMNISIDEWDEQCMKTTYNRVLNDFIDFQYDIRMKEKHEASEKVK
jgi:hypothetical protein